MKICRSLPLHRNHKAFASMLFAGLLIRLLLSTPAHAAPDQLLPPIGGPGGGQFFARCVAGDILTGVDVFFGDDVDGIKPMCREVHAPSGGGFLHGYSKHFGGYGGASRELLCPPQAPSVTGIEVSYEGADTIIVNSVHVFCGLALPNQPLTTYPTAVFDGPTIGEMDNGPLVGGRRIPLMQGRAMCPAGLVAVGLTGRVGKWLDAVSLICGSLPYDPAPPRPSPITSIGRVNTGAPAQRNPDVHSICDAARDSLARQSPAAANLITQCRAQGGNATAGPTNIDLETIRARGEAIAAGDVAKGTLRASISAPERRGFEIGLGIWDGNTAPGPGKQRFHDALTGVEQRGFDIAAAYALPRNKYDALVKVGLAIDAADAEAHAARMAENDPFYWLGFDIASGLFGDPAAGSQGIRALDAGSVAIRTSLNAAAQRGFNNAMALHVRRAYP